MDNSKYQETVKNLLYKFKEIAKLYGSSEYFERDTGELKANVNSLDTLILKNIPKGDKLRVLGLTILNNPAEKFPLIADILDLKGTIFHLYFPSAFTAVYIKANDTKN